MSADTRPYDAAFSPELLEQVRERRLNPDGVQRKVKRRRNPETREVVNVYPWDDMLLGDYFIVPLNGKHFSAMRTRFKQVALRRDFEITCVQCTVRDRGGKEDDIPAIRVSLTYTGSVKELKAKAGVPASDGRWTETRRERREAQKEDS